MYINFEFKDGSNPYVTTTRAAFWRMICKYSVVQESERSFAVEGRTEFYTVSGKKPTSYQKAQAILREFAWAWQNKFAELRYSWGEAIEWAGFFEEYGAKYGLLREFKKNGIA